MGVEEVIEEIEEIDTSLEEITKPAATLRNLKKERKAYGKLLKNFEKTIDTYAKSSKQYSVDDLVKTYGLQPKQQEVLKAYHTEYTDMTQRKKDAVNTERQHFSKYLDGPGGSLLEVTTFGGIILALMTPVGWGILASGPAIIGTIYGVGQYTTRKHFRKEHKIFRKNAVQKLIEAH